MMKLKSLLAGALLALATPLVSASELLVEGETYRVVADTESAKPKVTEFFSYACSHCMEIEPFIHDWLSKKPKVIGFERVPVSLRAEWQSASKAYYLIQSLKLGEKSHSAMFEYLHKQGKPLNDDKDLKAFLLTQGASGTAIDQALKDPALADKLKAGQERAIKFQIMSTPGFVVNDKYYTDAAMAQGRLGEVLDALALKNKPMIFN